MTCRAAVRGFYLYKAAVEQAGGMDALKIVAALSQVSFDGPRGVVKMDRQRHAALTMRLGQVQQDGSIKILQTFERGPRRPVSGSQVRWAHPRSAARSPRKGRRRDRQSRLRAAPPGALPGRGKLC